MWRYWNIRVLSEKTGKTKQGLKEKLRKWLEIIYEKQIQIKFN